MKILAIGTAVLALAMLATAARAQDNAPTTGLVQGVNLITGQPILLGSEPGQRPRVSVGAHSSTLTWSTDADATTGYNVYEQNGACPATAPTSLPAAGFSLLNSAPISGLTYTDGGESPGTRCFFVTALAGAAESNPSNDVAGTIKPAPPTGVTWGGN